MTDPTEHLIPCPETSTDFPQPLLLDLELSEFEEVTYPDTNDLYRGPLSEDGKRDTGELAEGEDYPPTVVGRYTFSSDSSVYVGCFSANLRDGLGDMCYESGETYVGGWKADCRHGQGTMLYQNGDRYQGDWAEDHRNGSGLMIYSSSEDTEQISFYEGGWENGLKSGSGRYVQWVNSATSRSENPTDVETEGESEPSCILLHVEYVGEFKDGKRNGEGTETYRKRLLRPDSTPLDFEDVYEGSFLDDKKHGRGTLRFGETGTIYEGDFVEDQMEGSGRIIYGGSDEGHMYEGPIHVGKKDGTGGRETYRDGSVYAGQFENDLRHGEGTMEYQSPPEAKGNVYMGEWRNNKRDGQGNMEYVQENAKYHGTWANGRRVEGVMEYADGSVYHGQFHQGKKHGKGEYEFASGDKYEGEFRDNMREGSGVFEHLESARIYDGQWEDDEPVEEKKWRKDLCVLLRSLGLEEILQPRLEQQGMTYELLQTLDDATWRELITEIGPRQKLRNHFKQ